MLSEFDKMRLSVHGTLRSEAFEDLTPQQINDMDLGTYAKLTGRSLKVAAEPVAEPPAAPDGAFTETVEAPQRIDLANMDMATYTQFRHEAGIGRSASARGIFGN